MLSNSLPANNSLVKTLEFLVSSPNLCSKNWISEQYDSQVRNDTIAIGGDAAIVRINNTKKALAITTDCNPYYVFANPFEGAKQAVAETYRNISATGAKPLAITNCLNFGNPQKPEIMGQIVKSIKGINEACKILDYPVVSGNVSLYNETDGQAIKPTPAIGGVGLIDDVNLHCKHQFKNLEDSIYLIGNTSGHLSCSVFEREILKNKGQNPPIVNLELEKLHSKFVRFAIANSLINSCHDLSCGGLLVAIFEMSNSAIGCKVDLNSISTTLTPESIAFGEDQSRYLVAISKANQQQFLSLATEYNIQIQLIGKTIANNLELCYGQIEENIAIKELQNSHQNFLPTKFS